MSPVRILTSPVRTTGGLPRTHLAALIAADAVARWARAAGHDVEWMAGILAADLAGQYAVERELAREGQDRTTLDRDDFGERARAIEAADRQRAADLLAGLRVAPDARIDWPVDDERVLRAARIAFVRLFEAGLLERAERVVATCPRCATVVDDVDAEPGQVDAEAVVVRFRHPGGDGGIDVELIELELLPGVVAVLVPSGHAAEGRDLEVPLTDRTVPVVAGSDVDAAAVLVPAHGARAFELAREVGVLPIPVLDTEGVVQGDGPLHGLGRYAARAAARELLTNEGDIVAVRGAAEPCARCRRCGTIVVPRLGWHWFLPMTDLEVAAADAVREGEVTFSPPSARDAFLARAGQGGAWCLSHQVWSGYPVPAGRCLDCNQTVVAAELPSSCGKCMGPVVGGDDVLDARFLGAVWPLAVTGWPDDEKGPQVAAPYTTLVVGPTGMAKWALTMAAFGVRMASAVPFSRLSVHPAVDPDAATRLDGLEPVVADILAADGPETARLALLSAPSVAADPTDATVATATTDADTARVLVQQLRDPPPGEADVGGLCDAVDVAMAAGAPAAAVSALAGALAEGLPPGSAATVRAAAAPLLGEDGRGG